MICNDQSDVCKASVNARYEKIVWRTMGTQPSFNDDFMGIVMGYTLRYPNMASENYPIDYIDDFSSKKMLSSGTWTALIPFGWYLMASAITKKKLEGF